MRVASVCSSVGGFDLGLHRAGHRTVAFCEIEPWRRKVLARHWPGVPIHHDLKVLHAHDLPACDVVVGGTPCQDLSNAGLQAGLDGERSGLFHAFAQLRIDLYEEHGCAWSVWENVAGAFSSNGGRDFATVLASHVGAEVAVPRGGWPRAGRASGPWGTAEWRLLDAQFFGVPQRRRRVFVVGHLGGVDPTSVLADTPRGWWDSQARGEATPDAAARPARRPHGRGSLTVANALDCARGGVDDNDAQARHIVAATLTSGSSSPGVSAPGRRQEDEYNVVVSGTLRSHSRPGSNSADVVAFHATQDPIVGDVSPALGTNMQVGVSLPGVRRLTPTERTRLMGWPDDWTYDRGPSLLDEPQGWPRSDRSPLDLKPDGRREAATGDGVVAHVAEWIGLGLSAITDAQEGTA